MESLILATGSSRNRATVAASTLRARLRIWNPITALLPVLLMWYVELSQAQLAFEIKSKQACCEGMGPKGDDG
jgi:hypothetical protein